MISFKFYCICGEELEVYETEKWGSRQEPVYNYIFQKCDNCVDNISEIAYREGFEDGKDEGMNEGLGYGRENNG